MQVASTSPRSRPAWRRTATPVTWRLRRETAGSGALDDLVLHAIESGTPVSLSFADGLAVQRALTAIERVRLRA